MNTTNYKNITESQLLSLFETQYNLNCKVFSDWYERDLNFRLAASMEMAEAIESLPWKWWKYKDPDYNNLQIELVDIAHFLLSETMKIHFKETKPTTFEGIRYYLQTDIEIIIDLAEKQYKKLPSHHIFNTNNFIEKAFTFMAEAKSASVYRLWELLFSMWHDLKLDTDTLAKMYLTKNILNEFRYSHGYKEGTYKKLWNYNDTMQEDNIIAFNLSLKIFLDKDFKEKLLNLLEEVYSAQ